jgi:hypothetical protein
MLFKKTPLALTETYLFTGKLTSVDLMAVAELLETVAHDRRGAGQWGGPGG